MSLTDKRILLTGGQGFLGHHVTELLKNRCKELIVIRHDRFDLLNDDDTKSMYAIYKPDTVIHLAARVGGIQYNQVNSGKLFYENIKMGINVIHYAQEVRVKKLVCIGTICSYPKIPPRIPFQEEDLWLGYPEETNAPYGIAKKALLTMCQAYRHQYGMNCIYLMPVNMYGPHDNFKDESSHVIPALIKRFLYAKQNGLPEVKIWGSGQATREFLYVGDCAKVIVAATDSYDKPEPLNIGSGQEILISDLAKLIAGIIGYSGGITFDNNMPDGQPRRVLDISHIQTELSFNKTSILPLEEGLRRTTEWYLQEVNNGK